MKSVSIRSTKPDRKAPAPRQQAPVIQPAQKPHVAQVSPCEDLPSLIAKRAYELYSERGDRHGSALDDWLEAEREILSQVPPASRAN